MTKIKTNRPSPNTLRLHAKIWLGAVVLLSVLWLVLWLTGDDTAGVAKKAAVKQALDKPLPSHITNLIDFKKEVKPIDFNTVVRDLRTYSDEFKDKRYFEEHRKKWTVDVMDVMDYQVIIDYLETRSDREKFAYFRYTDTQNKERFRLTYGRMSSITEAAGAVKEVKFNVPKSVADHHIKPEEMQRYLDLIDNYQRPDHIEKPRKKSTVDLEEAKAVVAPKPSNKPDVVAEAPPKEPETTSTSKPTPKPATLTPDVVVSMEPAPKKLTIEPKQEEPEIIKSVGKSAKQELAVPPTAKPTAEASFNEGGGFTIGGKPIDTPDEGQ